MVKSMDPAYEVETIIRSKFPTLQHASDGLIFTSPNSAYVHGSDPHMYVLPVCTQAELEAADATPQYQVEAFH